MFVSFALMVGIFFYVTVGRFYVMWMANFQFYFLSSLTFLFAIYAFTLLISLSFFYGLTEVALRLIILLVSIEMRHFSNLKVAGTVVSISPHFKKYIHIV